MLVDPDLDPAEMNADLQPCLFWWRIFSYGGIFFRGFLCANLTFDWSNLSSASSDWLVLPLGLKWAQECIAALSVWYHVVAWSLPLLKTTAALLLSVVGKFPT